MVRPITLVDVDDVLADFATPAIDLMCEVLERPWTLDEAVPGEWDIFKVLDVEQRAKIQARINDAEWLWQLKPTEGGPEFIEELRGLSEVFVLTSAIDSASVRVPWLREHYGFDTDHLIFTRAKHMVMGDFFLDDHPGNIHRWKEHHFEGHSMLWTAKNNIHLVHGNENVRVFGWADVIDRVRNWHRWSTVRPWCSTL